MFDLLVRLSFPGIVYVFAFFYYQSIKEMPLFGRGFPQLVMFFLLVFATVSLISDLREWTRNRSKTTLAPTQSVTGTGPASAVLADARMGSLDNPWVKTWIMLVLSAGLAWGFVNIGWYTSLAVFLTLAFVILGVKLWPIIALVVPGLIFAMYLLFDVVLGLRLPAGTPLP